MVPSVLCGRAVAMVVRRREKGWIETMQWDSVTDAMLANIELAVQGIASTDAAIEALKLAKAEIDQQLRELAKARQGQVKQRALAMAAALDGHVSPHDVASRGDVK